MSDWSECTKCAEPFNGYGLCSDCLPPKKQADAIIHGRPEDNPEADPLRLLIQPGSATAEEIAELLSAISELYVLMDGSPIVWKVPDKPSQEK